MNAYDVFSDETTFFQVVEVFNFNSSTRPREQMYIYQHFMNKKAHALRQVLNNIFESL